MTDNVTPFRWNTVPDGHPEPGIYAVGHDEEMRKQLNFKPNLMSYSKLNKFLDPDKKISPYVAGVGNLVSDRLLLGADSIPGRYYFHDEQVSYATKAGKSWRDQFQADNPGVTIIRPKQREEAERLIEAALACPELMAGLNAKGIPEAGIVADLYGVRFRSWVDKLTPQCVLDIKTTRCATPEEFEDSITKYSYDAQAALYLAQCEAIGLGRLNFRWGVISKTSGRAWLQELDYRDLRTGMRWVKNNAGLFRRHGILEQQLRDTLELGLCLKCNETTCECPQKKGE